jgi:SAM-dependent methyltransferase
MRADYARIFQDEDAVERYERMVYAPATYPSAVNARQRAYLRELSRRAFPHRRPVQHDFACGTGRALRLLHGAVRAAHGYDTSAAMLARARGARVRAELHEIAEDGPLPVPATTDGPAEVRRLLARYGFEIVERRGFAICPPGAYRKRWLRPLAQWVDDLAANVPWLAGVCTNVLYVARRVPHRHTAQRKALR